MNKGIIVIHGAPGNGNTTVGGLLHEKLKCPWFEFGWIPEFRNLNPHTEIPYSEEEELSFSSLALVAKNYLAHGFEYVILTDLPDRLVATLPEVYGEDGYMLFMLYSDDNEIIKNRIMTRTNGNLYKDWETAIKLNRTIKERPPIAHETRIRSDQMSAEEIAESIYGIIM
ncbi:MAG TPA: hypothetical protein PK629_05480 [Oscillospiraceae bacterium]|nr:hypothetical protein [Oscillospiraceae bacterium]HPF55690.1 hypothetical protein [Clostridiales bacterium]HPK35721.1 hypothetical protein [Oscillospiraceae bacterium]HPR75071.1 hypothetical protein [Oscillospiraceae bacterium]